MTAVPSADRGSDYVNQVIATYDAFAPWYDPMYRAQGRKPGAYREEVVRAYAEVFGERGVRTVLDCACGTGDPILGLAQLPDFEASASDGSGAMVAFCARNALLEENDPDTGKRPLQVRPWGGKFMPGSIELGMVDWLDLARQCGDRRFDLVMCAGHAIYHLMTRDAIIAALRSMAAVTAPGGYVMFDTLQWTGDLHGEQDGEGQRESDVRFRGYVEDERCRRRLMFMSSAHYEDVPAAACGVVQAKRFFVFEEADQRLREIDSFNFRGAPFDEPAAREMAQAAGLVEVEVLHAQGDGSADLVRRYLTVIGRKLS